jgi:predicted dehydrogenase
MNPNRRQLLKSSVAAASAASIAALAPSNVFSGVTRRDDTLRVAAIGFGGRGKADLSGMRDHKSFKLTAACDVDKTFFKIADEYNDQSKKFQDYRKLFEDAGDDFDAVLIATPDHMHGPIATLAMQHDKHVYLQKPLAQDVAECRSLAEMSRGKPKLKTQMGIQIHAHAFYRTAVTWLQSGLIGKIQSVDSWSGKGWGGEQKPKDPSAVPDTLDWDLYVGVSPETAYVDGYYHRNNWRKWFAFGTGTQGDMGCHILDPVFNSLHLKEPISIVSKGPKPFEKNFALISEVHHQFKGTKFTADQIRLTWYNGSLRPKELKGVPANVELPHQGSVFVGETGTMILPHIGAPVVYDTAGNLLQNLPKKEENSNHFHDWIDAAVGEKESASAPFDYAGPLTEAVLLGTIINRWPDQEFGWDATTCKFTGDGDEVSQANALLAPAYRKGW